MEFLFDTANIEEIKKYGEIFPFTGVTSNPSIIKAEGKINFFNHFSEIRKQIGNRTLHVQTIAENSKTILKEAEKVLERIDDQVYIKIPATEEGLKAIQALKLRGVNVTATAIYTEIQGFMAIQSGADYIAPYFNRMENLNIRSCDVIESLADYIALGDYKTKIVAASFKNIAQVNDAISAGTHAVTVQPVLLHDAFGMPSISKAVKDFANDWKNVFGAEGILDL